MAKYSSPQFGVGNQDWMSSYPGWKAIVVSEASLAGLGHWLLVRQSQDYCYRAAALALVVGEGWAMQNSSLATASQALASQVQRYVRKTRLWWDHLNVDLRQLCQLL
jgi:hypothetical protein